MNLRIFYIKLKYNETLLLRSEWKIQQFFSIFNKYYEKIYKKKQQQKII